MTTEPEITAEEVLQRLKAAGLDATLDDAQQMVAGVRRNIGMQRYVRSLIESEPEEAPAFVFAPSRPEVAS
jgi:hypothetical protein